MATTNEAKVKRLNSLFANYCGMAVAAPPAIAEANGCASAEWMFPQFEARLDIDLDSGESSVFLSKPDIPGHFDISLDFEDEEDLDLLESELDAILSDLDFGADGFASL